MNGRSRLNLALLVAVAALALFAYYKPHKSEPEHKLSVIKAAEVTSIKVEIAGSPPITLARTTAEWKLTAPLSARGGPRPSTCSAVPACRIAASRNGNTPTSAP